MILLPLSPKQVKYLLSNVSTQFLANKVALLEGDYCVTICIGYYKSFNFILLKKWLHAWELISLFPYVKYNHIYLSYIKIYRYLKFWIYVLSFHWIY